MASFPHNLTTAEKIVDEIGFFKQLPDLPHHREGCGYKEPVPTTNKQQLALEAQITGYIGKQVRVEIQDGRRYQGTLYCYDWLGNIILSQSSRIFPDGTTKHAGVAMVPLDTIVKIQAKLG